MQRIIPNYWSLPCFDSLHGKQQHCTLTHVTVRLSRHFTRHDLKLLQHASAGSSSIRFIWLCLSSSLIKGKTGGWSFIISLTHSCPLNCLGMRGWTTKSSKYQKWLTWQLHVNQWTFLRLHSLKRHWSVKTFINSVYTEATHQTHSFTNAQKASIYCKRYILSC